MNNNNQQAPKAYNPERQSRFVRWSRKMWRFAAIGLGVLVLYLFVLSFFTPSFRELEDPSSSLATEILSIEGKTIGRYYEQNRVRVEFKDLSPYLVDALVATEDVRFMKHSGIDARAIARAVYGVVTLRLDGGGSTISQQLAKLLYSDRNFTGMGKIRKTIALVNRKFSEWITAVKLERRYTKQEIIAMYFNQVDYVNNASGIKAASEIYFNTSTDSLTVLQAATFVGMLQNPALFNPKKRPAKCKARRNVVLSQMVKYGKLKQSEYVKLSKKDIELDFKMQSHSDGMATYFRAELAKEVKNILKAGDIKKPDGSDYNLYRDGLKVYTTINYEMQTLAEEAMVEHMKSLQSRFFSVWKGKDPWTHNTGDESEAPVATRKRSFEKLVRESERYQTMHSLAMDDVLSEIKSEFDLDLTDSDLDMMIAESKKAGSLDADVKKNNINSRRAGQLKDIMGSPSWGGLKKKWAAFGSQVTASFNKKVKMKVFTYNGEMSRDTTMSPYDSIRYHRMFLQMGSVAIQPDNGHVKMWVGGVNYKYFQYDHVRTHRQVGSTFKPFVYATAIAQQGMSPCTPVLDVATTIERGEGDFQLSQNWTPKNSTGYSGRNYTLFEALKESVNTVSVSLLKSLGSTESVRGFVNNMGIDSSETYPSGAPVLTRSPAICLGASDLKVLDMAGAYNTFANNGTWVKPTYLLRIEDKNGQVLYENTPEQHNAIPVEANYVMLQLLKYVAKGAPGISSLGSEIGGKTGTTNNYVDGWYMAVTPNLTVGTWVGGDDKWIRFLSIGDGQGAKMARPFTAGFLKRVEANALACDYTTSKRFKAPESNNITFDCQAYSQSVEGQLPEGNPSDFGGDPFAEDPAPQDSAKGSTPTPKPSTSGTTGGLTPKPVNIPKPGAGIPPKQPTSQKPKPKPSNADGDF
jgi:penicillin-binding protein 1A